MENTPHTFGTAFNCMDGRCQEVAADWMRGKYGVRYVDAVTGAGMDALLPGSKQVHPSQPGAEWWKFEAQISAEKHGSKRAAVIGHAQCGGNSVSNDEHFKDIRAAVEVVRSWGLFETVVGLFAFEGNGGQWQVAEVPMDAGAALEAA